MSKKPLDRALSLKEIVAVTGQNLPSIHAAKDAGHLKTYTVGRRRYARESAVQAWLDYLQKQSDAGKPVYYRRASA